MERKSKVTQAAVNAACEQLQAANKNVTVNAVIGICGGSFSTVGAMVKLWREEQAKHSAPLIEMPDSVNTAMQRAALDIWTAASNLAGETVERIQNEAGEAITKAKADLSEYEGEVSRLEHELEQAHAKIKDMQSSIDLLNKDIVTLTTEKTALDTRLTDRDGELSRLRADYEKLQAELIKIAKTQKTPAKRTTSKTPPKKSEE